MLLNKKKVYFKLLLPLLFLILLFSALTIYEELTQPKECTSQYLFSSYVFENNKQNINYYDINLFNNFKDIRCVGDFIENESNILINKSSSLYLIFVLLSILYYFIFWKQFVHNRNLTLICLFLTLLIAKFWIVPNLSTLDYLKYSIYILVLFNSLNIFLENFISLNTSHIKELDALRGFAVLIVIVNHFDTSLLPNGFIGVDVFFVISGYVITKSILKNQINSFNSFYLNFIRKRFKRLFPTLFYVIIISTIFLKFVDLNFKKTFITGMFSLVASSNIYLSVKLDEYFSEISKFNAFLHTWSLGLEEQFYIIYPILFYFLIKNKKPKIQIIIMLFLIIPSLYLFLINYDTSFSATYYLLPFRFWEILIGSLIALLPQYKSKYISDFLLFSLFTTVFFINFEQKAYLHLLVVLLTALLIYFIQDNKPSVLKSKFLLIIGILSYSLYLWHYPVKTYLAWISLNINLLEYLCLLTFLSFASYYFIEDPLRRSIKWKKKDYIIPTILFIIILSFIPSLGKELKSEILINDSFQPIYQKYNCHLNSTIEDCLVKEINKNSIFIIGDSHASNHFEAASSIFSKEDYVVNLYIDWNVIYYILNNKENCEKYDCNKTGFKILIEYLFDNLSDDDIVVFSVSRDRFLIGESQPRNTNYPKLNNLDYAIQEIVSTVESKNSILILVDDIPKPCLENNVNFNRDLIKNGFSEICSIEESRSINERKDLTNLLLSFSNNKNVYYFDPHSYLCFNGFCPMIKDSYLLYGDLSPHTLSYTNVYLEEFWKEIKEMLLNES